MATVEINANKIKNETIAKLTKQEISELGLLNVGIYTYKGTLKTRIKGFKTTLKSEEKQFFESEAVRYEVIKIVATCDEKEYAIRCYNKVKDEYEEHYNVLAGCKFFK